MDTYIVCCGANGRAVIIGESESEPKSGEPIRLTNARMLLYWSAECGGLFGFAQKGPQEGTRITEPVEVTQTSPVTEWLKMSQAATEAVAAWPSA